MTKLNDAITLHEIHDQAQEKAAVLREAQVWVGWLGQGECISQVSLLYCHHVIAGTLMIKWLESKYREKNSNEKYCISCMNLVLQSALSDHPASVLTPKDVCPLTSVTSTSGMLSKNVKDAITSG
jgi:hypothetical protein